MQIKEIARSLLVNEKHTNYYNLLQVYNGSIHKEHLHKNLQNWSTSPFCIGSYPISPLCMSTATFGTSLPQEASWKRVRLWHV